MEQEKLCMAAKSGFLDGADILCFLCSGFLNPKCARRAQGAWAKKLKPFAKGFVFFFVFIFRELNYE